MPFLLLFTSFNALPSSITLKSIHASIFYFSKSFVFWGVFPFFLSTCGKDYLLSPLVYYVVGKRIIMYFKVIFIQ